MCRNGATRVNIANHALPDFFFSCTHALLLLPALQVVNLLLMGDFVYYYMSTARSGRPVLLPIATI